MKLECPDTGVQHPVSEDHKKKKKKMRNMSELIFNFDFDTALILTYV